MSKTILLALAAFLSCLAAYLGGLPWMYSALGLAVSLFFRYGLRGGWQADAELNRMALKPGGTMTKVIISHLPHLLITLAFLGYGVWRGQWYLLAWAIAVILSAGLPILALKRWNYTRYSEGELHIMRNDFWDCRRPTEIATGIAGGTAAAALLHMIAGMV